MDTNKLTQKSAQALKGAQELATEYGNPQIEQSHLLCSLVFQEDGLIPQLLTKMGITVESFRAAVGAEVEKLPKVSGARPGSLYISQDVDRALRAAEEQAQAETAESSARERAAQLAAEGVRKKQIAKRYFI